MTEEIKNQNEQMLSKSHEAAMAGLTALPKPLKVPSASWCRMFQKNWGWSLLSAGSEAQAYLPYDHVDMVMSRNHVKDLFTTQGVHPGLLLNFDQVWRQAFSHNAKLRFKPRHLAGVKASKTRPNKHSDKKIHHIRGSRRSITAPRRVTMSYMCVGFCAPRTNTLYA